MDKEFTGSLILNAALLLSLSIFYNLLFHREWKRKYPFEILLGVIIGGVGILLITNSVTLTSGIIFDTRSILISTTGMFFGAVPTIIAMTIIALFRVILGGDGMITGVLVTILTGLIGLFWRRLRFHKIFEEKRKPWLDFYLVGVISHLVMLSCFFALPPDQAFSVLRVISAPVLLIYPAASLLLCMVLFTGYNNRKVRRDLSESELNFRTIFEQSPIGIAIVQSHRVVRSNPVYEKILGRTGEELRNMDWDDYTHPDDLSGDRLQFEALESGKIDGYSMRKRYLKPDGSIVWVNMMVVYLKVKDRAVNQHLCMIQDISKMIEAQENLKRSEENYKNLYHEFQDKQLLLVSLINSIPDLIFYKDFDGVYMGCNDAFAKFVGKDAEKILGNTDYELFDKETAEKFREMDRMMLEQKRSRRNEESVAYPDGSRVLLETLKTPFYDPQGNAVGLIGVSRDITERKLKEEKILYLNYHDVMTDLYNRTFFDEEIRRMDAPEFLPLSIIIGDINGLKQINDAFGQDRGDKLIVETAQILKRSCRSSDRIARTGGDEFTILLPNTDAETVRRIYEEIRKSCEEHRILSKEESDYTSISFGYATKNRQEEPIVSILKLAEEYMYRRKLLESKSLHSSNISSIRTTMYEKSDETEMHAERLALLSKELGQALRLKDEDLVSLELVSTLHDIGKISIDRNILTKGGKLTEEEWAEIRRHPEVGYRIAQTVPELRRIAEYILCHHERWDGKGYPGGPFRRKHPAFIPHHCNRGFL